MRDLTLVFDLDGTLVDTAPDLIAATNHALADLGLAPVPGPILRAATGFGARRMIEDGLRQTGTLLDEAEINRLHGLFLRYYEANIAVESRPFPGAVAQLEYFHEQGARLAVCTNKRKGLSVDLLQALGLDRLFTAVAGRDTFPVSKPHPDHLLGAIRLAGGDQARAIMIGDTRIDIETAKAARVPIVAVSFGYSEEPLDRYEPEALIGHYDELRPAIAALAAAART